MFNRTLSRSDLLLYQGLLLLLAKVDSTLGGVRVLAIWLGLA